MSVIVPIYKCEKYLQESVDSILAQTYRRLEVILVDDGSPDECPQMCDQYALCDSRIVVIHQENKGVAAARNSGLEIMSGEFVLFVDSDDALLPYAIEILLEEQKKIGAQLVMAASTSNRNWRECDAVKPHREIRKEFHSSDELIQSFLLRSTPWLSFITRKLFSVEVIGEKRFPALAVAEDKLFFLTICFDVECAIYLATPLYYYRIRAGSLVHGTYDERKICDQLKSVEAVQTKIERDARGMSDIAKGYAALAKKDILDFIIMRPHKEWDKERLMALRRDVIGTKFIESSSIQRKTKVALWILRFGILPYFVFYRIYSKIRDRNREFALTEASAQKMVRADIAIKKDK